MGNDIVITEFLLHLSWYFGEISCLINDIIIIILCSLHNKSIQTRENKKKTEDIQAYIHN